MATSNATLDQNTATEGTPTNSVDIKTENAEYRVYANLDANSNVLPTGSYELVSVNDFSKWEAARKEKNEKAGQGVTTVVAFSQTIRKYRVSSVEALGTLIGDPEEAANIANRGISAKFSQKSNSNLLEVDEKNNLVFQPVEGVYDSIDWLQEETVRKNLSPMEKVQRDLKKNLGALSTDDMANIKAMLEQLMAGQQQS